MATQPVLFEASWERMIRAVELAQERFDRTVRILEEAQIPYAVIGARAVEYWVTRTRETSVRNTPNADFMINRIAAPSVIDALASNGFRMVHDHQQPMFFLDSAATNLRSAMQFWLAGERVKPEGEP